MIFLTVGTQFPFDRLVKAVDVAVGQNLLDEEVFAQIGRNSYVPKNFDAVVSLEKNKFNRQIREASSIIGHAGIGSIMMALENHKPMLVVPRLKQYGEVVNNHQLNIAMKFEQRGYLVVAYDTEQLQEKLKVLKRFEPQRRQTQAEAVVERISRFLSELCESGGPPEN